ncbi:MAG: DUF3047 domain-containing protein [Burkholderiales bacterium]
MKRVLAVLLTCLAFQARGEEAGPVPFSPASPGEVLPAPWHFTTVPKVKKHTRYSLVEDAGVTVLRAEAHASMATLTHALQIDPHVLPVITWRWKIGSLLEKSDPTSKDKDDFPARVYVLFDYDIRKLSFGTRTKIRMARALYGADIPLAALCYVWDARLARDTSMWNAYTDRVRVIVAESGAANVGRWVEVRRNVLEDFRAAFGEDPPPISGVAIATDTDNTGESVVAWYGDIRFLSGDAPK